MIQPAKRGRPRTDPVAQHFTMTRQLADALYAYAEEEVVSRPQAVRMILSDWLRTHGYGPADAAKPEGPATEVVEAMEAAIKEHRKTKRAK